MLNAVGEVEKTGTMKIETEMEMDENGSEENSLRCARAHGCSAMQCHHTCALILPHHTSRSQCWLQNYGVFRER